LEINAAGLRKEPCLLLGIGNFWSETMPVYHFNIVDGVTLEDPVGFDCESDLYAKIKADLIAQQIAIDLDLDDETRCVVVVDERGAEIHKAPVKPYA
jgi:hypothetical protein